MCYLGKTLLAFALFHFVLHPSLPVTPGISSLPTFAFQSLIIKVELESLSHVRLFATPWTVAYQAPQSMEFSRQEYWSEWPFPPPRDLPNPGIEPRSPALQADSLPSEPPDNKVEEKANLALECSMKLGKG